MNEAEVGWMSFLLRHLSVLNGCQQTARSVLKNKTKTMNGIRKILTKLLASSSSENHSSGQNAAAKMKKKEKEKKV